MTLAAIISEYNPFHSGHALHIQKTREAGATHVLCLMSGSVVQRGDIAVFSAHGRAVSAIKGGADLVLELPPQISLAPARDFAKGAVGILNRLGVVDFLSFGAECPDTAALCKLSENIEKNELKIKEKVSLGRTYPRAVAEVLGNTAAALSGQNNILAAEYIRALRGSSSKICPIAIERTCAHDGDEPCGDYASASYIRGLLQSGMSVKDFVGHFPDECPAFLSNCEQAILFRLSAMEKRDFEALPYCGELASKLYAASRRAASLDEIFRTVKSRNFTLSKVRRAVIAAALGVTSEDMREPAFVRVLALNQRGAEILREFKSRAEIAVGGSLAELEKLSPGALRQAKLTELSSRLRALGCPAEEKLTEYERSPIFADDGEV